MLKVLRKISGHSSDAGSEKPASARRKDVNKDLRKPYDPQTSQYPRQAPGKAPLRPGKPQGGNGAKPETGVTGPSSISYNKQRQNYSVLGSSNDSNASSHGSMSYMGKDTHESLIKQNRVNRKRSEHYYIYDFEKYRGPTDETIASDPDYDIFQIKDGISASSARYVIHYLTNNFKEQLLNRFSHQNNNLDTDVLKASMEIFKPNLSHFSSSEIHHCKKIIRSFFPWQGCSLTGTALEKAIAEHYGDYSNPKHWTRLILSLRIIWSHLSHGIVPWKCYQDFCQLESRNNYPTMSFYNLLPQCLPNHDYTCSTFEFLEVLVAIISKIDLVVDKNAQMDLIFTAGQVCFVKDQNLQRHLQDNSKNDPDLISLGKLYYARGTALLHLFVAYLRSLAEEGKIKDFYLIDNFHIDNYPPHPYKPVAQTALTLTVPSFIDGENDFNTLLKNAAKAQSRIYSSNHSFSKQENAFLDKFEEGPYKVFDTLFSRSSKRYLYKFDKKFDPNSLKLSSESGMQQGLGTIGENDQYAVATWIEHCKGQDFSEFLNVLDDSGLGEGTLAFGHTSFNFAAKKQSQKENFSPVRVSKMALSEWFISSWKYETFLHKVHNTLLIKLTKRVGDCDWLVLSTDERVGKSSYLTPPSSSDSAKALENVKIPAIDSDNASIKSRPPPPNLLGDKSSSPLLDSPSSSLYSSVLRKPVKEGMGSEQKNPSAYNRNSKRSVVTAAPPSSVSRREIMTPVEDNTQSVFQHDYPNNHHLPPVMVKINNPSLVDLDANGKTYTPSRSRTLAPAATPEQNMNIDKFGSMLSDQQRLVKPLDFSVKIKSTVIEEEDSHSTLPEDDGLEVDEDDSLITTNTIQKLKAQLSNISSDEEEEDAVDAELETGQEDEEEQEQEDSTQHMDSLEVQNVVDNVIETKENPCTDRQFSVSDANSKSDVPALQNEEVSVDTASIAINSVEIPSTPANDTETSLSSKEANIEESKPEKILEQGFESAKPLSQDEQKRVSCDTAGSFQDASSVLIRDDSSLNSETHNTGQEDHNQSSVATTAGSAVTEKQNVDTEIGSDRNSKAISESDKNDEATSKSISLTPNNRLMRASALIEPQSSPNDILNDLIDNYNAESLVTVSSEGATLFERIKSQMERVSNGKDLPPIPATRPVLHKLKMDVVNEEDNDDSPSSESLPLVTPTKGTATIMSGFSYNATPPMKQEEFKYNGKLTFPQDSVNTFYSSLDHDTDTNDHDGQESAGNGDEFLSIESADETTDINEENKAFRNVMLKTKKSFKSLKNKSLRA